MYLYMLYAQEKSNWDLASGNLRPQLLLNWIKLQGTFKKFLHFFENPFVTFKKPNKLHAGARQNQSQVTLRYGQLLLLPPSPIPMKISAKTF